MVTNSVQRPVAMNIYGILEQVTYDVNACTRVFKFDCETTIVAESTIGAMDEPMRAGSKQRFLCEVCNDEINDERTQEARGGERQCHDQAEENSEDMSGGDANARE